MFPLLLVISFDAFMFQYFEDKTLHLPNFESLMNRGVVAKLQPQFTSKTFPNHWAMVSGLYEENNNIVGNSMYDDKIGYFHFGSTDLFVWNKWMTTRYTGEPIWHTNEQSKTEIRHSGVYHWPGSYVAEINGSASATYVKHYNQSNAFNFTLAADTVVEWFTSKKDVNFVMLYFPEPDNTSHGFGPMAPETLRKVEEVDTGLGYLIRSLKKHPDIWNQLDMIVLSDHGMSEIHTTIDVSDLKNKTEVFVVESSVLGIRPQKNETDFILEQLRSISNVTVYFKDEVPERYHYRKSERIMEIIAVADEGFAFCECKIYGAKAQHGYDPLYSDMHGIFVGSGPSFRSGYKRNVSIEPIDTHAIMTHILKVSGPKNDGNLSRVEDMLRFSFFDGFAKEEAQRKQNDLWSQVSSATSSVSASTAISNFASILTLFAFLQRYLF